MHNSLKSFELSMYGHSLLDAHLCVRTTAQYVSRQAHFLRSCINSLIQLLAAGSILLLIHTSTVQQNGGVRNNESLLREFFDHSGVGVQCPSGNFKTEKVFREECGGLKTNTFFTPSRNLRSTPCMIPIPYNRREDLDLHPGHRQERVPSLDDISSLCYLALGR
jgi:hypothetical protein